MSIYDEFIYDEKILYDLFAEAKEKDEFEFCCTLLRVRGMHSAGWDSLNESQLLMNQMLSLINAPLQDVFRIRLCLILYCHITEMNDFYHITMNLLRIIQGDRYSINPFDIVHFNDNKQTRYPIDKVQRIKEISSALNMSSIGELYDYLLLNHVRNAVFHSDYVLYNNEFRIISGKGINIEGTITNSFPIEWLFKKIEICINLISQLLCLINEHRRSYKEEKIVKGRIATDQFEDITLTVDANGLSGFRC
jgi:hypothetical protein